ncbi:MAG: hypothetical protein QM489_05625 [Candidatus Izemoplasma sp.]
MDRSAVKFNWQNSIIYIIGIFTVALGVVIVYRSRLGAGPWDTVSFGISEITGITIGWASIIVTSFLTLFVLAYRKDLKFLAMAIPIFSIGMAIDFWDIYVFGEFAVEGLKYQIPLFISGYFVLVFGLSLVIITKYPAFVFDELMLMLMEITGINDMRIVRIGVEITAILTTLLLVLFFSISMEQLGYGTIIMALTVGIILNYFLKVLITNEDKVNFAYKHVINVFFYIVGGLLIAFGVVLLIRSDLGVSSWDTLHYSLSKLLNSSFGLATIIVASVTTIYITIRNRNLKYILMIIPIIFVALTIDLLNEEIILNTFEPTGIDRFISFSIGLIILPMGASMLIVSTYPAGVFDELMLTLMKIFKTKNLFKVRVIMEFTVVLIALIIGLIAGEGIGLLSYGTIILSFSIGYIVKVNLKFYQKVGRYSLEEKTNN